MSPSFHPIISPSFHLQIALIFQAWALGGWTKAIQLFEKLQVTVTTPQLNTQAVFEENVGENR